MDLALAKLVESRLSGGGRLDAAQYGMLTQACRQAKEILLGSKPPASYTVTVVGRGRQVVGRTQHASLTGADIRRTLFDGFFPVVAADAAPLGGTRVGLHEMGLPYVSDPAITRQLAAFLHRHASGDSGDGRSAAPHAVLFNGGVFPAAGTRQRVLDVMHHWYDSAQQRWQPLVFTNPSLDLAVAWGAARYAWLSRTGGRGIGGGIAHSYYVAVEAPWNQNETLPAATAPK